jgi:hypothetical protein
MKITPVLLMSAVEPSLEFWTNRLGFEMTVSVPAGDKIGFVILVKGSAELMLQSYASAESDVAELMPFYRRNATALFIEVDDFDDTLKRLEGLPHALALRTTFYGMKEVGVYEPGGHLAVFAAKV